MPTLALLRAISILTAVGFLARFTPRDFDVIYYPYLFCHYTLSFCYGWGRLRKIQSETTGQLKLVLVSVIILVICGWFRIPLYYYFGLHSLFSDLYLLHPQTAKKNFHHYLFWVRLLLNCSMFAILVSSRDDFFVRMYVPVWALFGGSSILFILILLTYRKELSRLDYWQILLFEASAVLVTVFCYESPTFLNGFVFYHLVFWMLLGVYRAPHGKKFQIIWQHVLLYPVFALIFDYLGPIHTQALGYAFAIFHITTSFAISSLNPVFFRRFFYSRPLSSKFLFLKGVDAAHSP